MPRLSLTQAQTDLPAVVSRTAKTKERTVLSRGGKDVAAVIPIEDLRLLENLRIDELDVAEAHKALSERGKRVGLREFMRHLGD